MTTLKGDCITLRLKNSCVSAGKGGKHEKLIEMPLISTVSLLILWICLGDTRLATFDLTVKAPSSLLPLVRSSLLRKVIDMCPSSQGPEASLFMQKVSEYGCAMHGKAAMMYEKVEGPIKDRVRKVMDELQELIMMMTMTSRQVAASQRRDVVATLLQQLTQTYSTIRAEADSSFLLGSLSGNYS